MTISTRQERTRQTVRRAILDAARVLFVSEGFAHVSMRKIAARIDYSPAAIYSYFRSKDEIFFALAAEGFQLLVEGRPRTRPADPIDAIRGIFRHYYRFSCTHPEYFALMFVDRAVPTICTDWTRFDFVRRIQGELAEHVDRAVAAGQLPAGTSPLAVLRILGTAMLGAAVRRLGGRTASPAEADALAHDVLEATLHGLRLGSPVTFDRPPSARRGTRPRPADRTAAKAHAKRAAGPGGSTRRPRRSQRPRT